MDVTDTGRAGQRMVHARARGIGPGAGLGVDTSAARVDAGNNLGLRERKKARLRQQIIDTAIRLFRERGYEETRVDDIVRDAPIMPILRFDQSRWAIQLSVSSPSATSCRSGSKTPSDL